MMLLFSGTPGKETRKLVILSILFAVVFGAYWLSLRRSQTAPKVKQISTELPATVDDAQQPLPLGSMRVETVPDAGAEGMTEVMDMTGIPAPSGEVSDREGTIEKDYLFDILKAAKRIPAAELRSRAKKVPFGDFFDNPENWRGEVMRVEGRVRRLVQRRNEELPEGIEVVYEAQIMAPSGYWYWVFVVEKPRFGTDTLVVFDGIFMKIHAYKNRKGTITRAPLFVCKNFEKLEIEPSSFFGTVGWITVAIVIAGLIFAIIITRTQRRSSETIARAVEDKRLARARRWAKSHKEEDTGNGS